MNLASFMKKNFKHFNAASCVRAAQGWVDLLQRGEKMLVTLAGAMSTAELGITLAEMIRQEKVHAICCTGANLEEDLFNLVAHSHYRQIPGYRHLSLEQEEGLLRQKLNRVTDTCIPEEEAMRKIEDHLFKYWKKAEEENKRYFPHEFLFQVLENEDLQFEIDPKNSWLIAALEKKIPIFVPGWEDSTLGNFLVGHVMKKNLKSTSIVKPGLEYMLELISWYKKTAPVGFFQIGGGIAGDFPICVVPLIHQDIGEKCPVWSYFCQISDSTTSYGSYSGATPSEKITWGKLHKETPSFIIESDATIIAPLIFQYVLDLSSSQETAPSFREQQLTC